MGAEQLLEEITSAGEQRFVYWDRGGPPGRGYKADHLTVIVREDGAALELMKTRYDEERPPYFTRHYALSLPGERPVDVAALARQAFSRGFPEEKKPPIGGVVKRTFAFSAGDAAAEKTFFHTMPADLAAAQRQAEELIERCEREGTLVRVSRPRG